MTREHILAEIRRTARANGNVPLGRDRFFAETGIKYGDWHGRFWIRWNDALQEAGFGPNALNAAKEDAELLEALATLIGELQHFPVKGELLLKRRTDPTFPSHNTFARFGTKDQCAARLLAFAQERGYDDVAAICAPFASGSVTAQDRALPDTVPLACVYLLRSGRYFKIGRTNAVGRRERELAIQLPDKSKIVHEIKTDDPAGIEEYWHKRFRDRRKNGEWFQLAASDVAAFRRRQFM